MAVIVIGAVTLVFVFLVYAPLCVSGGHSEDEKNETQDS